MDYDYIVEPKSRRDLRMLAYLLRKLLQLTEEIYFPIVELLDILCEMYPKFSYAIVEDNVLPPNVHADTDIVHHHIRIKESVYDGASKGNGRDRMTIAHEIGHYFTLCCCGFKLRRQYGNRKVKYYQDPEWQAKCFAGELMISRDLTYNMSPDMIVEKCGVSYDAACYQYERMHEKKRVN